jgi:hypothetical protein
MKSKICALICFVLLFSCKTKESPLITYDKTADGWLNIPTTDEFSYNDEPADIPIVFIQNDKLYEAADRLQNDFFVKLTNEEYEYFTGKIKNDINTAYLIRSVNYSFNENGYRIYKNNKNNLLIFHGTLGSGKRKGIQKWPIIILYNDIINQIYSNYSVIR